jgi:uncharacterized protein (TIGR03084 family)
MLNEADDFRDECDALHAALVAASAAAWERPTQFKGWSFDDVLGHLYMFDHAARLTATDPPAFREFMGALRERRLSGRSVPDTARDWLQGCHGQELLRRWHEHAHVLADTYRVLDPATRVPWSGPDMSVRSCISARQMETWAHGQEVFDSLGLVREERDRIRNIAVIGVNTFGWSFANRKLPVPPKKPYVRLLAPSGATWEFNEPDGHERIEGAAVDFCRVVTQTRNVADTGLMVLGPTAVAWMDIAQCFAGPPMDHPAPGTRFLQRQ